MAIELIDKIKQKNGGTFKLMDAEDIAFGEHSLTEEIDSVKTQLSTKASEKALAVERARIDNLSTLSEGSTTGDAELIDARTGANGVVYENLGQAIRKQIDSNITHFINLPFQTVENHYISHDVGEAWEMGGYCATEFIKLVASDFIYVKNLNYDSKDAGGFCFYDKNKKFISGYQYDHDVNLKLPIPEGGMYVRFTFKPAYKNQIVVYQDQLLVVEKTTSAIDDLTIKTDNITKEIALEVGYDNTYTSSLDTIVSGADTGDYHVTTPITVRKNSYITVIAEGYQSNVSIISKYLGNSTTCKSLVPSQDGVTIYHYLVPEDMEILVCSKKSIEWKMYMVDLLVEPLQVFENEVTLAPQFETGHYIAHDSGERYDFGSDLSCTTFTEIDEGFNTLIIQGLNYGGKDAAGLAFYNENKNFISGYQYDNTTNLKLEVPSNARYFRFTIRTNMIPTVVVKEAGENLVEYLQTLKNKFDKIENHVENDFDYCQIFHKIAGIGDSLMSGELAFYSESEQTNKFVDLHKYSWLSNLCKNIGAEATHYSSGGQSTKSWLEEKLNDMKSESVLPSAYYIGLGTNDASDVDGSPRVPLGTIADCDTNKQTFYGYYSRIIKEVKEFNPHAKIFCCSLYYTIDYNLEKTQNYCRAISEMCDKYGCYYIDFFSKYGEFYSRNDNVFMSVGHFTSPGYVRVGKEIQQLTNEVISGNQTDFMFVGLEYKDI
jgi:lysophospholipase L1-like esterase|nr:MAG TPA: GDSL like Lipase Acylhydrolase [Caudoviricetes sp.]